MCVKKGKWLDPRSYQGGTILYKEKSRFCFKNGDTREETTGIAAPSGKLGRGNSRAPSQRSEM